MAALANLAPGPRGIEWIVVVIVAVTFVAAAAIAVSWSLKRRAAVRHSLLLSALMCILSSPVLAALFMRFGVSILSLHLFAAGDLQRTSNSTVSAASTAIHAGDLGPPAAASEMERSSGDSSDASNGSPRQAADFPPLTTAGSALGISYRLGRVFNNPAIRAMIGVAGLIWAGGVIAFMLGLARNLLWLRRLRGSLTPASARRLADVAHEAQRLSQVRALPTITVSEQIRVPFAFGMTHPIIVLPADSLTEIPREQLRDVLVHEMAHIARGDFFVGVLQAIARAVFWPIPVVHLLNRDLARAREEVCDNYVLAGRDVVSYGETLLRFAELAQGARPIPAVVGMLHWRGELEGRIAGLIHKRRSMVTKTSAPVTTAMFVLVLAGTVTACSTSVFANPSQPADDIGQRLQAASDTPVKPALESPSAEKASPPAQDDPQAATPNDKLPPAVRKLVEGLHETESAIRNLSVTTEYVKLQQFSLPVDQPVRMELVTKAIVDSTGRGWNDCTGEQVNIEPNGKDVRIYKGRWTGAFDGKVARSLNGYGDGKFHSGGISNYLTWHGIDPRDFTTDYFDSRVSAKIEDRGATVAGQVPWDGRTVTIVDTIPQGTKDKRKYRFWIDPERKIVVRRAIVIQFLPGQPWQEYTRIESSDHEEIAPGIWLPMHVMYESVEVTKELAPEKLSWSYEGRNRDWKVNQDLPDKTFALTFPPNVRVNDHRPPKE